MLKSPQIILFFLFFIGGCSFLVYLTLNSGASEESADSNAQESIFERPTFFWEEDAQADDAQNQGFSDEAFPGADTVAANPYGIQEARRAFSQAALTIAVDADDAGYCTSHEMYDDFAKECFYECETKTACAQIGELVADELSTREKQYNGLSLDLNLSHDGGDYDETSVIGRYNILTTGQIQLKQVGARAAAVDPELSAQTQALWDNISHVLPGTVEGVIANELIRELIVYDQPLSETAAFVDFSDSKKVNWTLYINLPSVLDQSKKENAYLYVHELAHVLTLNHEQVDPEVDEGVCERFYTDEGCTTLDSYLFQFFDRFWTNSEQMLAAQDGDVDDDKSEEGEEDEEDTEGAEDTENTDARIGSSLYDAKPGSFVSPYAATNPGEDIAESFAAFVLRSRPPEGKDLSTIAEQKLQFFYNFEELVTMRSIIRRGLGIERVSEDTSGEDAEDDDT